MRERERENDTIYLTNMIINIAWYFVRFVPENWKILLSLDDCDWMFAMANQKRNIILREKYLL